MTEFWISLAAFLAIFGGALAGLFVRPRLPPPHLDSETRTTISVSMAVVGSMTALVLGLMTSNASTAFSRRSNAIETLAVAIVKLDRNLARFGPDAGSTRSALRAFTRETAAELGESATGSMKLPTLYALEALTDEIEQLHPSDERQTQIRDRAVSLAYAISDARWELFESYSVAIPNPLMALLIFWLSLLFLSFGLFAPRNPTVIVSLLLCALAIAGGIYMILELGSPDRGLVRSSPAPLQSALVELSALD